jgi:hypothetical protein
MATETVPTVKAATIKELRAACPGATEKFLVEQLEAEATEASASKAWLTELSNRSKALEEENKTLKAARPGAALPEDAKGKKAKAKKKEGEEEEEEEEDEDGDDCHDKDECDPEDAIKKFDALVSKEVERQVSHGQAANRLKAVMNTANRFPNLHQAYLIACNGSGKRAKRLVSEKYEQMPAPDKR